MLEKDLKKYAKYFKNYTELRLQENREIDINVLNGNLVANTAASNGGVSVRVYKNGSWGFASSSDMGDAAVLHALETAGSNADFLDMKQNLRSKALPSCSIVSSVDLSTKKRRKSQKELLEFVMELDAHIAASYRDVVSRRIWLTGQEWERNLVTADGTSFYSLIPTIRIILFLTVEKNGARANSRRILGSAGQLEDVYESPADLYGQVEELHNYVLEKIDGVSPSVGMHDCIFGPDVSGLFVHESIGHGFEATGVLAGSPVAKLMNRQAASPLVSITDFAHTACGSTCPVPVYADEEGVEARDVVLMENGIVRSFMHNKESAACFGVEPAGNARAATFSDEPLIRMRNTAILPGKSRLQDMISSIEDGYYFMRTGGGPADLNGDFTIAVIAGYQIKNGKLGKALKDTSVSGNAYEVLNTISMVSDKLEWLAGGLCVHKQWINVGMGGPAIKCRVTTGGK